LQKAALKQLRCNKKVRGITLLEPKMNPLCIIQSGFKLESYVSVCTEQKTEHIRFRQKDESVNGVYGNLEIV